MFKWVCLAAAALFAVAILWLLFDLKRDVTTSLDTAQAAVTQANEAVTTVNSQLPEIIDEVKTGTLAKSNQEVLYRACYSGPPRRKPYFIQLEDAEPERLDDFIKRHHPQSAELPAYPNEPPADAQESPEE